MDLICATCSQPNPPGARLCLHCSSIFPPGTLEALSAASKGVAGNASGTATETLIDAASDPSPPPTPTPARTPSRGGTASGPRLDAAAVAAGALQPGGRIGTRYEVVKLLGKGGMGSVYLARDLDLGRDVAMKLIAPHLAGDAGVLERFKREIQLSSIVTHPNVLRVYDLGESDGVKFLTMQYIEGETLADLLARERPPPRDKVLPLFRQICGALAAAHEKGVLHRDLKPQNVMLDASGRAYLMDFGLATSRAVSAMTQAGAIMGTPQYMSPEQVKGAPTDARSDIFSLGVMLYELLSGQLPFNGDNLFEIMIKRTQGPPRPLVELDPEIPGYLRLMVDRCLAVDPVHRYHDMEELLFDLDAGTVKAPIKRSRGPSRKALLAAGALLAAVVAGGVVTTVARRGDSSKNAVAAKPVTVLVADFDNRTGEDVFNGTLEPALGTALEGASFITVHGRGAAQRLADKLKLEGAGLSEKRARLVAQREGIGVVATGYIEREGSGYRVDVRAVDAFTGQRIVEQTDVVGERGGALASISRLAAGVRGKLGDKTPSSVQLKEAETFSAASLEAAHDYALGVTLRDQGKYDDAKKAYERAIKLDPSMGRAYSGIAVIEDNLGRRAEAKKYFQEAMARIDRMTEREKYRTLGAYYIFSRDFDRSIEAYNSLLKQFPADSAATVNLGYAYQSRHDFPRGLEASQRAVTLLPNDGPLRGNLGGAELFMGEFDSAIAEERKAIELSPLYLDARVLLALAQLASGDRDGAVETWQKMRDLSPAGASLAAEGLADVAVYEGRLSDARTLLDDGIKADVATKDTDGVARKLAALADVSFAMGDRRSAIAAAQHAMKESDAEYIVYGLASMYAAAGNGKALELADELGKQVPLDARMYAELVRSAVQQKRGNSAEAIARAKAAVEMLDAWVARFALARAYFEAGNYAAALDEFDRCEKRRGETADAYQANTVPTLRLSALAKYYLARTHDALKSPAAAEKYQAFLDLKKSDEDPLVQDARKRLAALGGLASKGTAPGAAK